MLHVNDDIELFRKAAENYPLNTGKPDWNNLKKKMNPDDGSKKSGTIIYLCIGLALLLSIANPLPVRINEKRTAILSASENVPSQKTKNYISEVENFEYETPQEPVTSVRKRLTQFDPFITNLTFAKSNNKEASYTKTTHDNKFETEQPEKISVEEDKNADIPTNDQELTSNVPTDTSVSISNLQPAPVFNKKSEDKSKNKKTKKIYVGIIGGPDVSTVKLQAVKKLGFNYGVIAGYQHNKKWALETGVLIDKKHYSTDGKYFNTKNIPIPGYITIDHADGTCDMLEIPLNIRYTLNPGKKSSWSLYAGISSYLMKEEFYRYEMTRYGASYSRDMAYNEDRNSFLSVINIGATYSHRLGRLGHIRVEPFLKLPVTKVGIGSMPLQSAGIHFGFIRPLF